MNCKEKKELEDGNCGVVRLRGKEAYVKDRSLRTETGYKADCAGKLAQHSDAHSSVQEVKPEVVCRNNVFLPGETSFVCGKGFNLLHNFRGSVSNGRITERGVSRDHSTVVNRAGSSCRRATRPVKRPEASDDRKDRTREVETTADE